MINSIQQKTNRGTSELECVIDHIIEGFTTQGL